MAISYYTFYGDNEGFENELKYADLTLDLVNATPEEKNKNLVTWVHEHIKQWADSLPGNHQVGYKELAYTPYIGPLNQGFHIPFYPHHTGINSQFLAFDECNANGNVRVPMGLYDQEPGGADWYRSGYMGFYFHRDPYYRFAAGTISPAYVSYLNTSMSGTGDVPEYHEAMVSDTGSTNYYYQLTGSDNRFRVQGHINHHFDETAPAPWMYHLESEQSGHYQNIDQHTDVPPNLAILTCNDIGNEYFFVIGKDGGSGIVSTPEAYLPTSSKSSIGWQCILAHNNDYSDVSETGGCWRVERKASARGMFQPLNSFKGFEERSATGDYFGRNEFYNDWTFRIPQTGHWQQHRGKNDWNGTNRQPDLVQEEYTYGIPGGIHPFPRQSSEANIHSMSAAKLAGPMMGIVAGGNKIYSGGEVRAYVNDNVIFINRTLVKNKTDKQTHIKYNNKTYWNAMGNIWVRVA